MATEPTTAVVDAPLDDRTIPPLPPRGRHLTVAELDELVPEETHGIELLDGVLLVSPTPNLRHGHVAFQLAVSLDTWCRAHGGRTYVEIGVQLDDDTMLVPDVLVLDADQLAAATDPQYVTEPPTLVVEVSSPSTRRRDLGLKRDAYQRFGVAEYWFVDLDREEAVVHVRDDRGFTDPRMLTAGDVLRATTLPGLEVAVAKVLEPR